jgi:hypothetical protein
MIYKNEKWIIDNWWSDLSQLGCYAKENIFPDLLNKVIQFNT